MSEVRKLIKFRDELMVFFLKMGMTVELTNCHRERFNLILDDIVGLNVAEYKNRVGDDGYDGKEDNEESRITIYVIHLPDDFSYDTFCFYNGPLDTFFENIKTEESRENFEKLIGSLVRSMIKSFSLWVNFIEKSNHLFRNLTEEE
jgi:hypothetical protein